MGGLAGVADGSQSDIVVWLAGPGARTLFTPEEQTAADLARWREITTPRRREEWEVSRALLAHARSRVTTSRQSQPTSIVDQSVSTPAGSEPSLDSYRVPASNAANIPILSLSHSGGHAAVAASRTAVRIGVDLEHARPRDGERLARFAFSSREREQLEALPPEARAERFYILWTLKESFAKALSLSLFASLSRCTFVEERGQWRGTVPTDSAWIAQSFRPSPTLVLSVVALLPNDVMPVNFSVSTQEWPDASSQEWRTLATLHSASV